MDPVEREDNCPHTEEDSEWYVLISHLLRCIRSTLSFAGDYSFVRSGKDCVAVGPEPIPAAVCTGNRGKLFVIVKLRYF